MMKRFLKEKSSSKAASSSVERGIAVEPGTMPPPPSSSSLSVKPKKKKKSFLSIFSRKKKDKNSSKVVAVSENDVRRVGTEFAVPYKTGSASNASTQTGLEVSTQTAFDISEERSASQIVYDETSTHPTCSKSENIVASFEFCTSHSPDGSISSGFHEVHPSASRSESLSEPTHRYPIDSHHYQPAVGSPSKKPNHERVFQEDSSMAPRSGITGLRLDSNALILHPPLAATSAETQWSSLDVARGQAESVRRKSSPIVEKNNNNNEVDLDRPATKLWIGQTHPVTFADGTTRIFSWSLVGDSIVGTTVDDGGGYRDGYGDGDGDGNGDGNGNGDGDSDGDGDGDRYRDGYEDGYEDGDGDGDSGGDDDGEGDVDGRMDASENHLLIEDQIVVSQSKVNEMEEEDSADELESQHGDDQVRQTGETTASSDLHQTRKPTRFKDNSSESATDEELTEETQKLPKANTSLLAAHHKSSGNETQLTSPESAAASNCSCDNVEHVESQEQVSYLDRAEEFDRENYSKFTNTISKELSAPEEKYITSRHSSAAMSYNPIEVRQKHCDDSSFDGDTSSVFSGDAGIPYRSSGHSKLAITQSHSDASTATAVLSPNSSVNRAMWFDLGSDRSRGGREPEVNGIGGSVSSEFFRKSGVARTNRYSTLETSKVDSSVAARQASSTSTKTFSVTSKTSGVSRTDSISSPIGSAGDPRWWSVTDLTRTGSRSTSDAAHSRPTPPSVAADLARRFADINARFQTMAADAKSRRECGNLKEPDKTQSTSSHVGTRTQHKDLDDGHSTGTDVSWKFDGSLKRNLNESDRLRLENGRLRATKKSTTGSKTDDGSVKSSWELPSVSEKLDMSHRKTEGDVRDRRSENRKYSSSGDLHLRFSEDGLSFPSSVSSFSNSSSSHVPSNAANHKGTLTDTVGKRQVVEEDANEAPAVANRPSKKTMHEQLEAVRSQVDHWHKDLTLNSRLRYPNVFDGVE